MSVLMPNTHLGLRRRGDSPGVDAHGFRLPATWAAAVGPWAGMTREVSDGSWILGLDPLAWPVREHDIVTEPSAGREFLVITSALLTNTLDGRVNWVRVEAHERKSGGTEPTGAQFVAR